ncbi:MAG: putative RDD family membrane protein YckC, partial [Gammaproteobacteria bacterium]
MLATRLFHKITAFLLYFQTLTESNPSFENAGLARQFAAMLYDSLLILALLFITMGLAVVANNNEVIPPPIALLFVLVVTFGFYTWFWTKSGQTLGMYIWKIKIESEFGGPLPWQICILRLVFSTLSILCIGSGYWWRLFRPYTLADYFSQTRIIRIRKSEAKT